jgi:hypothetical protein
MAHLETLSSKAGQYSGRGLIAAFKLIARNFAKLEPAVVTDNAADHVAALTDVGKTILRTSGSAQTLTLPQNSAVAFPIGSSFAVIAQGAGALTVQAGTGATLEKRGSTTAVVIAKGRVVCTKVGANAWNVSGDLTGA